MLHPSGMSKTSEFLGYLYLGIGGYVIYKLRYDIEHNRHFSVVTTNLDLLIKNKQYSIVDDMCQNTNKSDD